LLRLQRQVKLKKLATLSSHDYVNREMSPVEDPKETKGRDLEALGMWQLHS